MLYSDNVIHIASFYITSTGFRTHSHVHTFYTKLRINVEHVVYDVRDFVWRLWMMQKKVAASAVKTQKIFKQQSVCILAWNKLDVLRHWWKQIFFFYFFKFILLLIIFEKIITEKEKKTLIIIVTHTKKETQILNYFIILKKWNNKLSFLKKINK